MLEPTFGKILIALGILFIILGAAVLIGPKIPFLGKLPGDVYYEGKSVKFYFPIVTCIILSIVLTIILNLFFRR